MKLTSPDFIEGSDIPERFTCDGQNIRPALRIEGAPQTARSLALIMDDPDAPAGTFTHWLLWNIRPDQNEIPSDRLPPEAVQGLTDFGGNKYGGPCPPSGVHRYYFKLYALDTTLDLPPKSKRKALDAAIKGHVMDEALLMGRYTRKGRRR